ncbi:MAG: Ig-like domain-containing protein [Dysosmobacter welbionis]
MTVSAACSAAGSPAGGEPPRPRRWRSHLPGHSLSPSFWPRAARRGPDLHRGERAQGRQIDGASFTYTPEDSTGSDSFTYTVTDSAGRVSQPAIERHH